jgi:hypothetical protein
MAPHEQGCGGGSYVFVQYPDTLCMWPVMFCWGLAAVTVDTGGGYQTFPVGRKLGVVLSSFLACTVFTTVQQSPFKLGAGLCSCRTGQGSQGSPVLMLARGDTADLWQVL